MKINKEQVGVILRDLYAANPGLRQYEQELEKIIREITELEPEIVFDEAYRAQLRAKLMARAEELSAQPANAWQGIFNRKFSYVLVGAAVVIVIGAGYFANQSGLINLPGMGGSQTAFNFKKVSLGQEAFGPLAAPAQNGAQSGKDGSATAPVPAFGLGGGAGAASSPDLGRGGGGQAGTVMYPSVYLRYTYTGEPLDLKDSQVEVLRRLGFNDDASSLKGLLKNFGFNLVNMGGFSSLKVQNINLVEDKPFGFMISSNVQDGMVFVSQNWSKWPQPYTVCAVQDYNACAERLRLKISDILPDDEAIKLAKDFVKKLGINTSSYGEPIVTDTWRIDYERTADKSQFYIPESANIVFPLKIDGQSVYDESGNITGFFVTVDHRQKRVSNVSSLASQSYQASNYAAETDSAKILKLVEQGGYWGSPFPVMAKPLGSASQIAPMENNELKLEVGTPARRYVLFTTYSTGPVNFLLVPSLIFPVVNDPSGAENYYYQKNIVVPLAKELIDQKLQTPPFVIQ